MKVLYLGAISCVAILACLNYAEAYERRKREASPFAEPGIAKQVGSFCNETMVGATSQEQFCKAVSGKIVGKVNRICQSVVKLVCKFFVGGKKKKCKNWLYDNMCPMLEGATKPSFEEPEDLTTSIPEEETSSAPEEVAKSESETLPESHSEGENVHEKESESESESEVPEDDAAPPAA